MSGGSRCGGSVRSCLQCCSWRRGQVVFAGGGYGIFGWILVTAFWPLIGALALVSVLILSLWRWRLSAPQVVSGLIALVALWPAAWAFGVPGMAYPASIAGTSPSVTVRLPSDAKLRVVWGGDDISTNYHAGSPGQRWAYDLVVEPAGHGGAKLEGYGCYGTPVLAPIAGTVHLAHDGVKDLAIGEALADPKHVLGNHVVLKLETGTFLVLAHLRPGSVAVKAGDAVTEGQVLGQCGNTGNTSEPHIHIHHQRQDPLLFDGDLNLGVNFVEGLPLFFRDHGGPKMPKGGIRIDGTKITLTGDVVQHNQAPVR